MEVDYDPILIKYSNTMIIEKKDRSPENNREM